MEETGTEIVPDTIKTDITSGTAPVSEAGIHSTAHISDVGPDIYDLLNHLNSEQLTDLRRRHFYEKKIDEKIKEPKGSAHPRFRGFKLKKDEFIFAIESVLNTTEYEVAAGSLFDRMVKENAEEHKGFLWWEQILDVLIEYLSEKTKLRPGNIVKESFCRLCTMAHCRRETIVRIVPVETPTSFCYVVVSNYGKVGIYDWSMNLLEQYEVRLSTKIATTSGGEVRRTTWVTDALYMSDAAMLLVAASDRSLHFHSATGLVCVPVYHISGLPNTPTCLHYSTSGANEGGTSMLLVGDDHGSITTIYFQQPHYALFKRTSNDAMDHYFWKELSSQKEWVNIAIDHEIHKDEITRVEYFSDNNTVVSCSNDPNTTVIIRYIGGRRAPYIFKISRGVRCFNIDRSLRLLVTGGKDSVVRVWNPIIPRKPIASLFGHKTCIVDVRILKHLSVILSISKDAIVKVWDIVGQTCMQTLPLLFPVYGALARTPEFGVQSFYPGPVCCKPDAMSENSKTEIVFSARSLTTASSSVFGKSKTIDFSSSATGTIPATIELSEKTNELSCFTTSVNMIKIAKSDTQYTNTEKSEYSASCSGSPWTRMELLAACCNYVVILQLSVRELEEKDDKRVGEPLNPPLRNEDPVVPSPWLTVDSSLLTGLTDEDLQLPTENIGVSVVPSAVLETLQKSLGQEMTQELTALATSCYGSNSQQTDLKQIRAMVDQCAPHLALGAADVEDIPFTPTVTVRIRKGRHKEDESQGKKLTVSRIRASGLLVEEPESSKTMSTVTTICSSATSKSNHLSK